MPGNKRRRRKKLIKRGVKRGPPHIVDSDLEVGAAGRIGEV